SFMPVVTIYNNKGGVGKSTLTVGVAEFLAANRKQSVLVIDLDAQASSSGALLGRQAVTEAISSRRTIAELAGQALRTRRQVRNLTELLTYRPASAVRGTALAPLAVLVADKPSAIEVDERMRQHRGGPALPDQL